MESRMALNRPDEGMLCLGSIENRVFLLVCLGQRQPIFADHRMIAPQQSLLSLGFHFQMQEVKIRD